MRPRAGGRVPHLDEEAGRAYAEAVEPGLEQRRNRRRGIEREIHGGRENAVLRLEVMEDQLRVHSRRGGDAPDGCPVITASGELAAGRAQDLFPRAAGAGPPTGPRHEPRTATPPVGRGRRATTG